jgi:hypothetical protein
MKERNEWQDATFSGDIEKVPGTANVCSLPPDGVVLMSFIPLCLNAVGVRRLSLARDLLQTGIRG